jgi:K+-sensing histidine kinase KdpD
MDIKNANNWSSYSVLDALLWSFTSFVIISFWMHVMGSDFYSLHPYKLYFFTATVLAYFFGYVTASIYIVISTIYANLYFVPPFGVFNLTVAEFERFLINLLFGSVAIFFIEVLQRARFKSKLLLLVSESRYLILLHRDNQLLQESKRKNNV